MEYTHSLNENLKWTDDLIRQEAQKYQSRNEFRLGSKGAYERAKLRGPSFFDDVTSHMEKKYKDWDEDSMRQEAQKYNSRVDFQKNSSAYQAALRRGSNFIDDITSHMTEKKIKWTEDKLKQEALKYNSISDFINGSHSAYVTAFNKGKDFLKDITSHMIKKKREWSDEEIYNEAKKYQHIKDFELGSPKAFGAAKNRGPFIIDKETGRKKNTLEFYKKVTAHMIPLGNRNERIIYVHEFRDENENPVAAYVGLTYNSEKRYSQHISGVDYTDNPKDTQVTIFMRNNPQLKHYYKELTDYMDEVDAVKMEREWEDRYKNEGWLILSKKRAGSLGGGFRIKDSDLKDFIDNCYQNGMTLTDMRNKFPNQVNLIYRRKLHLPPHNYLNKFQRTVAPNYTDESAYEKAMEYDSLGEIYSNNIKLYHVLSKRGLVNKVKDALKHK